MSQDDRRNLVEDDQLENQLDNDFEAARNGFNRQEDNTSSGRRNSQVANEPTTYTSQLAALIVIVNVTVGAGLLAMPHEVQVSGVITSVILQILVFIAITATCIICTELTVKTNANSYQEIVKAHCPDYVYKFTQVAILLIVFGTTVAYIVIIGDQSDRIFLSYYGHTFCYKWYMNRRTIMSLTTVFIIKPLCCAKTIDFLKYASFVGLASIWFIMYVVVSEFFKQGSPAPDVNYLPKNWLDISTVLPVFCLAYQCHLSWVPTVATVRKEEKYTSYKTITIAMIVASIIYAITCLLAVLTFGSKIQSDLTQSYSGKGWAISATIVIVMFKCAVTLPLAFLPIRLSLIDILTGVSRRFSSLSETIQRISVSSITLASALILALYAPDILVAVDILGSISVMFIFTLPGLCYLNLIKEMRLEKQQLAGSDATTPIYTSKDNIKRMISYFFIIFGTFMMIIVLYKSIGNMFEKTVSPPLCYPDGNKTVVYQRHYQSLLLG